MIGDLKVHGPCSIRLRANLRASSSAARSLTWKPRRKCLPHSIMPVRIGNDVGRDTRLLRLGAAKEEGKKKLNWIEALIEKGEWFGQAASAVPGD